MSDDDRLESLEMENDLLALEVASLRRGAADVEHPMAAERLARLEQAEKDLHWLLRRLGTGPLGWLARRRTGYRRLAARHLGDDRPS